MGQFAATKRGTGKRGGTRVSKTEVARRLDVADRLLREQRPRPVIINALRTEFGVGTRAADEYIRRARERWAVESLGDRDAARAATILRLEHLSVKAEKRGAFAAAVSAEKLRAQINGLLAAVEVKATVEAAASPPAREPTLAEALEELEAIEEILRAARPRLPSSLPVPSALRT